ncbi:MAG: hypothetical protein QOF60_3297 [Actinomycetota bacterium]|nr:hypothetical protein [Actinomycetota bacterium]
MNEERAREGVEHLQAAAIEVISAMKAFLDVAEDLVRDPASAAVLASAFAEAARAPGAAAPDEAADPATRVTRIRVS